MEWILAIIALFPWSLVVALVAVAVQRRRMRKAMRGVLEPLAYIQPPTREPILFDSAQIAKCLRETRH